MSSELTAPSTASSASSAAAAAPLPDVQIVKPVQSTPISAVPAPGRHDKEHIFWNTQPVPKLNEVISDENGPIDAEKTVAEVKQDPFQMPNGFHWCSVNVNDPAELSEVYTLLTENYVEDDENMFRFDYSREFLLWALTPPGYLVDLHVGVRTTANKLVGFISGIPAEIRVYDKTEHMVEINFLCVHKKIRSKRLAPVLIKEVTRRVNLTNRWQAVYTAGVVLPKPVARCRYYHRSINPKKLIEVNFSRLQPRMTMTMVVKLNKLPDAPAHNFVPLTFETAPSAFQLVSDYLLRTKLSPIYTLEEFCHWFIPRTGVVESYVLVGANGAVSDMCSFYHLPSSIIGHKKYNKLHAVYSYYNVATTMSLEDLMKDALTLAKLSDADVFNALDVMENRAFFDNLKFGVGDGHLQYYLYNWKCPEMEPTDVGLVLL